MARSLLLFLCLVIVVPTLFVDASLLRSALKSQYSDQKFYVKGLGDFDLKAQCLVGLKVPELQTSPPGLSRTYALDTFKLPLTVGRANEGGPPNKLKIPVFDSTVSSRNVQFVGTSDIHRPIACKLYPNPEREPAPVHVQMSPYSFIPIPRARDHQQGLEIQLLLEREIPNGLSLPEHIVEFSKRQLTLWADSEADDKLNLIWHARQDEQKILLFDGTSIVRTIGTASEADYKFEGARPVHAMIVKSEAKYYLWAVGPVAYKLKPEQEVPVYIGMRLLMANSRFVMQIQAREHLSSRAEDVPFALRLVQGAWSHVMMDPDKAFPWTVGKTTGHTIKLPDGPHDTYFSVMADFTFKLASGVPLPKKITGLHGHAESFQRVPEAKLSLTSGTRTVSFYSTTRQWLEDSSRSTLHIEITGSGACTHKTDPRLQKDSSSNTYVAHSTLRVLTIGSDPQSGIVCSGLLEKQLEFHFGGLLSQWRYKTHGEAVVTRSEDGHIPFTVGLHLDFEKLQLEVVDLNRAQVSEPLRLKWTVVGSDQSATVLQQAVLPWTAGHDPLNTIVLLQAPAQPLTLFTIDFDYQLGYRIRMAPSEVLYKRIATSDVAIFVDLRDDRAFKIGQVYPSRNLLLGKTKLSVQSNWGGDLTITIDSADMFFVPPETKATTVLSEPEPEPVKSLNAQSDSPSSPPADASQKLPVSPSSVSETPGTKSIELKKDECTTGRWIGFKAGDGASSPGYIALSDKTLQGNHMLVQFTESTWSITEGEGARIWKKTGSNDRGMVLPTSFRVREFEFDVHLHPQV